MNISEALSSIIQNEINHILAGGGPIKGGEQVFEFVRRFNVLPILADMGGLYGLRPNGEFVSIGWDEPDSIRVESEERVTHMLRARLCQKYSSLDSFAPKRISSAKNCSGCQGTGIFTIEDRQFPEIICGCGGLGWIP